LNLKDEYNKSFVEDLATKFSTEDSSFDEISFSKSIINTHWNKKELKERMRCITESIHAHLDFSYPKQIEILSKIVYKYGGLKGMVFPDFVQVYGLNDLKTSLKAIELFTQHSTAEFAIRPFIEKYPLEVMKQMLAWSSNKNHHLRRLSTEGARPKLPWSPALRNFITDPSQSFPILENLKNDDSLYVRKSVANHLNDISKDHQELVLKTAKKWHGKTKNTDWIVKHGLRTLLKKGDKKALAIFGLDNSENINVKKLSLSEKEISIGDFIYFEFEVQNKSNEKRNLRLEYRIDYVKANNKTSGKIFQLSEFSLNKKSNKSFKRKQWFKELSTRKHYPGKHIITLIINGDEKEKITLTLNN
jgi:3-methyladenine DNA glycosylase AlkC